MRGITIRSTAPGRSIASSSSTRGVARAASVKVRTVGSACVAGRTGTPSSRGSSATATGPETARV